MIDEKFLKQINQIHEKYYKSANFTEIEHIPPQFAKQIAEMNNCQEKLFELAEGECLIINYRCFDLHYSKLMKALKQLSSNQIQKITNVQNINKIAEVLLSLNGENQKAWNVKKLILKSRFSQKNNTEIIHEQNINQGFLERQLRFNGAICLKFKKSTCYFQYRQQLIKKELPISSQLKEIKDCVLRILSRQSQLTQKILSRFYRNYYCWLYRIKYVTIIMNYLDDIFNQMQQLEQLKNEILAEELRLMLAFLDKNMNDYSAYSYLINFILSEKFNSTKFIESKLELLREWGMQNLKFCELAYENKQSYKNLQSFLKYVNRKQQS